MARPGRPLEEIDGGEEQRPQHTDSEEQPGGGWERRALQGRGDNYISLRHRPDGTGWSSSGRGCTLYGPRALAKGELDAPQAGSSL